MPTSDTEGKVRYTDVTFLIHVPREQFAYPETAPLLTLLDEVSRRSGVSRGQAFEDFLHMTVCALSGGRMEEQYLATVKKHSEGTKGKRGCDSIAQLFGTIVNVMEETRKDVLGDLFQGAITYGEAGQFYTPESITTLMAEISVGADDEVKPATKKAMCDPCCGSGRMLLAVADKHPHWEFIGQDIDLRCVRMTAINLALRNLYGYVIWGDSLREDRRLVYRTGFDLRGFIHELPQDQRPTVVQAVIEESGTPPNLPPTSGPQLRLF